MAEIIKCGAGIPIYHVDHLDPLNFNLKKRQGWANHQFIDDQGTEHIYFAAISTPHGKEIVQPANCPLMELKTLPVGAIKRARCKACIARFVVEIKEHRKKQ